ncbi:unnamed protein product, partial [Mesorhabditis belari]|uniref:Uncharacterized protein n=1 Tax=Mesorhabditis belari TaxID=2138241 RepID=A0AAF3J875_9BILA
MSSTVLSDVESESDAEQPLKPKSLSELQKAVNPQKSFDVLVSLDDPTASDLEIHTNCLLTTRKFTIGPSSPSKYVNPFGLMPRKELTNVRFSSVNKRRAPINQMSLDETTMDNGIMNGHSYRSRKRRAGICTGAAGAFASNGGPGHNSAGYGSAGRPHLGGRSPQSSFDSNGDVAQISLNWMRVNGAMAPFKGILQNNNVNKSSQSSLHLNRNESLNKMHQNANSLESRWKDDGLVFVYISKNRKRILEK